jgi:glycosyltransferase involved in cell wall biosynthesis
VLETTERLAAACAHDVVCVSRSLREAAVKGGYVAAEKAHVLGDGSSNGVDASRFRRDIDTVQRGRGRLEALGVPATARIVGFVGRLVEDKGIAELLAAFRSVLERVPNAWLVLVGDELGGDHLARHVASELRTMAHVAVVGRVDDLAPFYSVMDVLAFPSHREGFPNVPLEAACMAVPTVGFASTGVVDAVVDSVTGTLVERGDVRGLADALTRYLDDEEKRRMHGAAAQRRALASFDHTNVWGTWASHYMRLATDRGLLSPA